MATADGCSIKTSSQQDRVRSASEIPDRVTAIAGSRPPSRRGLPTSNADVPHSN